MSYNGSGTFQINTAGQPVVANTVISATVFNALTSDLATGLSTAITKDGQTTITANIPFSNNKITGLGAGTLAADAAQLSQVQSTAAKLITASGTDTITGTMSPTLTAYVAGQLFYFVAAGANTTSVTLNVDGLGAKAVTRDGSTALAAGDINSGEVVVVIYDGTRFQMINAANSFGNTTINGTLTVTGNAGFQANVSITSALSVGGVFAVTGAATFTTNPTLSGGTANGVLYLNASKVATSGSALTFNGSDLAVSRGIKTGNDGIVVSGFVDGLAVGGYESIGYAASPGTALAIGGYRAAQWSAIYFYSGGALQATLSSTGLGIGTASPEAKLEVKQTGVGSATSVLLSRTTANVLDEQRIVWKADDLTLNYAGIAGVINSGTTGSLHFQTATAGTLATKAILDASGNLGLGVTPSAWGTLTALQVKNAALSGFSNSAYLTANAFYDGSNFKYIASSFAAQYRQQDGQHIWYTAPSGTAGNAITFTQVLAIEGAKSLALEGATPQSGTGITFPATQSASSNANTLDDYEEGTWTVNLFDEGVGGNQSSTTATGSYTKIGNLVFCNFVVASISSSGLTAANNFRFTIPFATTFSPSQFATTTVLDNVNWPAGYIAANAYIPSGGGRGAIQLDQDNGASALLKWQDINSGTSSIAVSFTYRLA